MKQLLVIFISLSFSLALFAEDKKLVVVSSASIFNDMAKRIGGDKIEAHSIVPIGGDPHIYEATPNDAKLVGRANVILINGLTFEGWINEVIENSGTKAQTYTITNGIETIASTEHANAVDPHGWMDVENGYVYIKNIRDALISNDPKNANYYEKNYSTYLSELKSLHSYIQEKINLIPPSKRILITSHDAFSYFGKKYGLTINAIMGVSTEADAQTSDIKRVIESINKNDLPAIFVESTINPKLLQQIATDNNVSIGGNLYADSIGEEGTEGGSYIGMLKYNVDVICIALSKERIKKHSAKNTSLNVSMYLFLITLMLLSWVVLYFKIKR